MELKTQIQQCLRAFSNADLRTASMGLPNTPGYRSEKMLAVGNTPDEFLARFDNRDRKLRRDKALFEQWKAGDCPVTTRHLTFRFYHRYLKL